jgi:small subunit ribosomal protein S16
LTRAGRRHLPFYHVGVFDRRTRRDGTSVERLGFYDPLAKGDRESVRIDVERAKYWLEQGARPSETVAGLLKGLGVSSELWRSAKTSRTRKTSAAVRTRKAARSVQKRTKGRTANSRARAEKKAKK